MRKFFMNCMLAASVLLAAGAGFVSCSDDEVAGGGTPVNPNDPHTPGGSTDIPTPITWYEDETPLTDYGVQIIAGVESENQLRFECIPGQYAKSYRLDVIPLAKAYDMLYTKYYDEIIAGKKLTAEQAQTYIKELMFSEEGSAAYTFAYKNEDGEIIMDDYATGHEFNWGADGYSQFTIVPDAEYLVCAVGCSDEDGANGRDMSILYLKTESMDLIGDPQVTVTEVQKGWSAFGVSLEANDDAKYFYILPILTKNYNEYIGYYGEKLFNDMIRFQGTATSTTGTLFSSYSLWADPKEEITVVTIGTDENYMMGEPSVTTINMPIKPEDAEPGEATISWVKEKTSASVAFFHINYNKYASSVRYRVLDGHVTSGADAFQLFDEGWQERNPNFHMTAIDEEAGEVVVDGEAGEGDSWQYILSPNTDYTLAYIVVNGYEQYGEVQYLPFTTKAMDKTSFDGKGTVEAEMTTTLTTVNAQFKVNDEVAMLYYKMVPAGEIEWGLAISNPEKFKKDMMDNLFKNDSEGIPTYNFTYPQEFPGDDEESIEAAKDNLSYGWAGLSTGTEYHIIAVAEDWNGHMCAPVHLKATTQKSEPGPNPEMKIVANVYSADPYEDGNLVWHFAGEFQPVNDIYQFYYGVFDENVQDVQPTYAEAVKKWEKLVTTGLEEGSDPWVSEGDSKSWDKYPGFMMDENLKYWVACCKPIGADNAQGDFQMVYYDIANHRIVDDLREIWKDAPAPATKPETQATASVPYSLKRVSASHDAEMNRFEAELDAIREQLYSRYVYTPSRKALPLENMTREEFISRYGK